MASSVSLAPLAPLVDNPLPPRVRGAIISLIGARPSAYSRSPAIWTAALARIGLAATYLPLDVAPARVADVLSVMRDMPAFWGANVTFPFKQSVLDALDDVEPLAGSIGAINTITRRGDGRLAGSNTDVVGFVAGLFDGSGQPLVESVYGFTVLLIGAGGAARAAAVALARLIGTGEILVTNRSPQRRQALVSLAVVAGARARSVEDGALEEALPGVDLVINASLAGQASPPGAPDSLEAFSSLAPVTTVADNHALSQARVRRLPGHAAVLDMVYAPTETVLLRHARAAGLRAVGGRGMMIAQAADACVSHICARAIAKLGEDREALRAEVLAAMFRAWPC